MKGELVCPNVGDRVVDGDGVVGIVCRAKNPHNIFVEYDNGGSGFYCIVPSCAEYDPLWAEEEEPSVDRPRGTWEYRGIPY